MILTKDIKTNINPITNDNWYEYCDTYPFTDFEETQREQFVQYIASLDRKSLDRFLDYVAQFTDKERQIYERWSAYYENYPTNAIYRIKMEDSYRTLVRWQIQALNQWGPYLRTKFRQEDTND